MADQKQIELVHVVAKALESLSDKYNVANVSADNDNDSGEVLFSFGNKFYVIRADDIREVEGV